ncbi:MAG: hypothetical protein L6R36_007733 [Xanthoria steineri]|nr:MAG: hypothetical protein L6R36_007733 [Xanthoria steineri]
MHGTLSRRFGLQGAEAELMHGFESLLKVARLMFLTPKWSLRAFCLFWLSVNFAAQMMSALISLQVTAEDGHDYNGIYTRSGQVNVSKIDCYYADDECLGIEQAGAMHAHAHIYGQMRTERRDYDNITDLITSKHDVGVWHRTDKTEFAHRFNEYNENDTQKAYPFFTNRVITSSAGECVQYDVKETPVESTMGDVDASSFTYRTKDGSSPGTILIPKSSLGEDGTTYIYRGVHDPSQASDPKVACGDRCMYVWVYRNPGRQPPALFQCPITISNVSNSTSTKHDIPDAVARVAAVSVALQGRWQGSLKNKKALQFHQYQFIPFHTDREVHFQNNKAIGGFIASFAMQSLFSMVRLNPNMTIAGTVPHLGSRLNVDKPALTAILVSIVVAHLIISIVTFMVAHQNG